MRQKKTIEDYLKTIYILQQKNGAARSSDLAEELGVSRPTVSITLKGLEEEEYIFMNDVHEIGLTKSGRCIAEETYEKHQTFLNLLISLGVKEQIAEKDACRMEHAVSPESYKAIKLLLADKKAIF